jgi:hypothetical protein
MQHYIPSRLRPFRLLRAAVSVVLLTAAGCTPMSEKEKEYMERRESEKEQQENFTRQLESGEAYNAVIKKVQDKPVEGGARAEDWVKLQINLVQAPEQVIYQKWTASQKAAERFEVRFLYTVLNRTYEAEKRGFLWNVDNTLDQIAGPITLSREELEPAFKKRGRTQSEIKREQNKWSLE